MDTVIALGHFCESHGPCVVLCTQKYTEEPVQGPHSLSVPWCDACQSLQLDQALVCREEVNTYITTRTPLQQDLAFLLKTATVRSLSCEVEGTLYFGDAERGHFISHSFTVHDSLARGFQRKYTILVLMKDKIVLLNMWPFLLKHIKEIARTLKAYSAEVNGHEQEQRPQRAVREAQGSPCTTARSLSQLTGKPAIYAHVHLWFAWLLGCQIAKEKPFKGALLPTPKPSSFLRSLYQDMGDEMFRNVCSLFVVGVPVRSNDAHFTSALQSLFPESGWSEKMDDTHYCNVYRQDSGAWEMESDVAVSDTESNFSKEVRHALHDTRLSEVALQAQLTAVIMQWFHTARVLCWCPQLDLKLLRSLNVQKCDLPLLVFWTSHCTDSVEKHKSVVKSFHCVYANCTQ